MGGCFPCWGSSNQAGKTDKEAANKDGVKDNTSIIQSNQLGKVNSDKSKNRNGSEPKKEPAVSKDGSTAHIAAQTFTFRELAAATKNFRPESLLGEGGFGRVYKGRLESTGQVVAVKQLDRNGLQGNREFLVEVLMLSLLHHPNLVNLIGYCADGDQRLLVYEYMPLGSLEDHLHDIPPNKEPLDWNIRMKIAAGAAKGLEYLHDKANPPVIYRDLKSSNILLDEGYHPKLSDFGLAKLGPVGDKTHVSTRVMGTYGYCAPEYAMTGQLTLKSDVYSFGVVFLELITGRKAIDNTRAPGEHNLVAWARPLFKDRRKFPKMADPLLQGRYPMRGLYQALAVAAMCLQEQAATRPLIGDVVTALTYLASQTYDPNAPNNQSGRVGPSTPRSRDDRRSYGDSLDSPDRRAARLSSPSTVRNSPDFRKRDHGRELSRILTFILGSAMKFPGYAKLKVLSLLKELGVSIMRVKDVESLLCDLLQRRYSYHFKLDKSHRELSGIDVDILCLLIEICSMPISSDIHIVEDHLLPALCIEGLLPDDAAIVRPCVAFLQKLNGNLYRSLSSETQQKLFQQLVLLYHDANNDVQNATREALLRLDVSASTVASILNIILVYEGDLVASPHRKKKSKKHNAGLFSGGRSALSSISSLLDVLLLKKDMGNRAVLIEPLFQLLRKAFTDKWVRAVTQEEWVPALSGIAQTTSNALSYIQQTVLLILEDIISSLSDDLSLNNGVFDKFDAALLVECAQSASDVVTSNHVYSLFATIAKVEPGKILHYIPAILAVISKSTVYHDDSHSKRVFEGLVSTVVPCWLSKMDGADNLLQIFINEMPGVAQHRRLSITLHLLKTLGESSSMGSLLVLLFRSLVSKERFSSLHNEIDTSGFINSVVQTEWEYNFAEQICEQYTCLIWLPSLVSLLKQLQGGVSDNNQCVTLLFALKFVSGKLQNPEVVMKLQSMEDMETIQKTLTELMVQVVFCWQFIDLSKKKTSLPIFLKKELKEIIHAVLMKITNGMLPSAFFQGVIRLLVQTDKGPRKKTLQVLCKSVRDLDAFKSKHERERNVHLRGSWNHLDGIDLDSFAALCLEILQLVDGSDNDLNVSVRLAAISALEILANKFPSNHAVFSKCLAIVVQNVLSDDLAVSSGCLRTAGALINVLGPRALPELPEIMKNVLQRTRAVSPSSGARKESAEDNNIQTSSKDTLMLAVLVTLEALVENLGAFLNPYLGDIVEIVLLHQDFVSESNQKIKSQADNVRRLVSEKVPVRLALPALQNVYTKAVKAGDLSLSTVFELLKNFVSKMDKSSVSGYHTNIFDLCMMALDLRSQHLASIKNINFVEKHVISAMIALTMKMTETMFKPLFLRSIEWVESSLAETNHMGPRNIGRAVSFYNLVNKLAENHRSLFVPYFKYLLEGFISFLSDNDDKASQSRKKKKAKIQNSESKKNEAVDSLSLEKWHLRALVLSSLHKCFLYDTGSVKFLDSTKFQLLLKPIVSQLIVEPPACIEDHPDIPSLEEADEILVSCVGQMAVTAGSDLLWKPLNYEVLMQTRSEMVRSRLLGLRIIKYLVENLKEEYLVLLAETIPFLAELLEDVELPVKTLAQEILKELESLSGENLQEYF